MYRAACWTFCSATAIYTTKRLMITHVYHYPLTIAFHSFLAIFLTYSVALYLGSESSNKTDGKWGILRSRPDQLWPNSSWLVMIPAALATGASLPMFLQGLLHMPSLAVLVMLFPISYGVEAVVLFICCSPSRSQKWVPWEVLVITGASSAILFNEYRLMVPGLIWGVTGVLFMGVARALFIIGSEINGSEIAARTKINSYHGFIIMTLVFGLFISIVAGAFVEHISYAYNISLATLGLMIVSTATIVGTAFSGTTLLVYSPISFTNAKLTLTSIPIPMTDYLASSISSILVILVAIHSSPVTVVSWIQLAAYLISSLCLLGASQIHPMVLTAMDCTQQRITKSFNVSPVEPRRPSRIITYGALFLLVVISSWSISTLSSLSVNSIPISLPATLDSNYSSASRFDIVVSMYSESPSSIKDMLDDIKRTTFLSTLSPNIIIYTKDPSADLSSIKEITGATIVESIPNLGREGGTYLHHMVSKWDTLAEQTMFIQAHPHNMRELLPRINSYLVPSTGMLSLSFTGVLCSCETCGDRWDWSDEFSLIPTLYSKIYHRTCTPDTNILLSYKGQFVASARRIRGVHKKVYESLLKAITSKDMQSWSHDQEIIRGREDTPDNPFLGFTVERIWGLLMQCATDGVVAAKCPSLLSGMGHGGQVADCQCLDPGS